MNPPKIALTAAPGPPRPAPLLLQGDLPGAFRDAARYGCQGVEIHCRDARDVDATLARDLAADFGLAVPTLGTGMAAVFDGLSFAAADRAIRARAVERVRGHIALAAELEAAVIIGSLGGKLGPEERPTRRAQALDALAHVCYSAAHAGVTVLLEPLNRYESDYLNRLQEGMAVLAEIGAPNLKLLADTFHMNIEETDLAASIRAAGHAIGHVHLADSNRQAPGRGHLDFGPVLEALDEIGYNGFLAFEVFPEPDPYRAIEDGLHAVRKRSGHAAA